MPGTGMDPEPPYFGGKKIQGLCVWVLCGVRCLHARDPTHHQEGHRAVIRSAKNELRDQQQSSVSSLCPSPLRRVSTFWGGKEKE